MLAVCSGVTIEDFTTLVGGGLSPPNGRLIFFTTNHVERMHSELLRLVDEQGMRVCFPNADAAVMEGMWRCFYSQMGRRQEQCWRDFEKAYVTQFGTRDARVCSAAAVQEYLMGHRTQPEAAAAAVNVRRLRQEGEEEQQEQQEQQEKQQEQQEQQEQEQEEQEQGQ